MADYYVDASVSSVSGSGSGTLGDPWVKTDDLLQFALDQIAAGAGRNAQNGDKIINLAGSMTVTAGIDPTTYGTPTNSGPLFFDGGEQRTAYDLGGFSFFDSALGSSTKEAIHLLRFDFTNPNTSADSIYIGNYGSMIDCSFVGSSSNSVVAVYLAQHCSMIGCKFTNINGLGLVGGPVFNFNLYSKGIGNYFEFDGGYGQYGIYTRGEFHRNILVAKNMASGVAIARPLDGSSWFHNTCYSDGTQYGLYLSNADQYGNFVNNYFENFGTGFTINSRSDQNIVAGNRGFNNAADSFTTNASLVENNILSLPSSGVIDAANGDFRPTEQLIAQGYNPFKVSQPLSEVPTIGAITGNIIAPRIRDLY